MEADDLFGLPLERFTEERNALARELRREGRRDEAAEVARLRKPSVAAWAVNQLVRTQRREVDQLFAAGDALREAQAGLLAGRAAPPAYGMPSRPSATPWIGSRPRQAAC